MCLTAHLYVSMKTMSPATVRHEATTKLSQPVVPALPKTYSRCALSTTRKESICAR